MKVLRIKKFSSNKYAKVDPFKIPKDWGGQYDRVDVELKVDETMWNDEMPLLVAEEFKKRARAYKKLLLNASNLFNDSGMFSDEDTHPLAQFSNSEKQVWSKKISQVDRFNYEVYKPYLDVVSRRVKFPVKIKNLSDHI